MQNEIFCRKNLNFSSKNITFRRKMSTMYYRLNLTQANVDFANTHYQRQIWTLKANFMGICTRTFYMDFSMVWALQISLID